MKVHQNKVMVAEAYEHTHVYGEMLWLIKRPDLALCW